MPIRLPIGIGELDVKENGARLASLCNKPDGELLRNLIPQESDVVCFKYNLLETSRSREYMLRGNEICPLALSTSKAAH